MSLATDARRQTNGRARPNLKRSLALWKWRQRREAAAELVVPDYPPAEERRQLPIHSKERR